MRFKFWNFKENRIFDIQDLRLFNDNMDKEHIVDGLCATPWDMRHNKDYHFQFDGKLLFDSGLKDRNGINLFDGDIYSFYYKNELFSQIIFKINNSCTVGMDYNGDIIYYALYYNLRDLFKENNLGHELRNENNNFWQLNHNNIEFWKTFKFYKGYFDLWYENNKQWFDNFLEFKKWKL